MSWRTWLAMGAGAITLFAAGPVAAEHDEYGGNGYGYRPYRSHRSAHRELGYRHERGHDRLDRDHYSQHRDLGDTHEDWHYRRPFASRRSHRRFHNRLEDYHEDGHDDLDYRHSRQHRRLNRDHDDYHDYRW